MKLKISVLALFFVMTLKTALNENTIEIDIFGHQKVELTQEVKDQIKKNSVYFINKVYLENNEKDYVVYLGLTDSDTAKNFEYKKGIVTNLKDYTGKYSTEYGIPIYYNETNQL